MWHHLETLCSADNEFVRAIALTWVLLILSALRLGHWQRSMILELDNVGILSRATLGKRKEEGRRRLRQKVSHGGAGSGAKVDLELAEWVDGQRVPFAKSLAKVLKEGGIEALAIHPTSMSRKRQKERRRKKWRKTKNKRSESTEGFK